MSLGKNIKILRERHGLTLEQLSEKSGVDVGTISALEVRGSSRSKYAMPLAAALGVTLDALMTDVGSVWDANVSPGPEMKGMVPLISWVQAGNWCEAINTLPVGDAEEWLLCPRKHGPSTFALRVRGVSMEPKYRDGAIIYVDPDKSADHLSNVVVRLDDEAEVTFKQLIIEGDKKFLRPLNPDWPGPKLIEFNGNATICGVVLGQYIED